jgi:hypothetical protein
VAALRGLIDGASLTSPNFERARALVWRTRSALSGLGRVGKPLAWFGQEG